MWRPGEEVGEGAAEYQLQREQWRTNRDFEITKCLQQFCALLECVEFGFQHCIQHASHTCQPHMPATHATTFIYHSKKQSLSENCTCVCMCVCVCMVVCALTCFVAGGMLGAPTDTVCGIDSQAQLWAVTVVDRAR